MYTFFLPIELEENFQKNTLSRMLRYLLADL
jgi:hypothetical protein